jgi:hypothetical protein
MMYDAATSPDVDARDAINYMKSVVNSPMSDAERVRMMKEFMDSVQNGRIVYRSI